MLIFGLTKKVKQESFYAQSSQCTISLKSGMISELVSYEILENIS